MSMRYEVAVEVIDAADADGTSREENDDDEARPLTRDELKAKTLNRMYRKGNRASGAKKGKK